MDFRATPINVTSLLVVTLGLCAIYLLAKRRLDTNVPLIFYLALAAFVNFSGWHLDSYLFTAGVACALMVRFEFMNVIFTTIVLTLEVLSIGCVAAILVIEAFRLPF